MTENLIFEQNLPKGIEHKREMIKKFQSLYDLFLKTDRYVCRKCKDNILEEPLIDAFENYCRTQKRMKQFTTLLNYSKQDVNTIFCPKLCICPKD